MAITIKEIHVKVTVESDSSRNGADEETLLQMKREIIKELKETMRKEKILKNER
ncbi:DUF5908 family protein [Flavobacterium hauense]